MTASQSQTNPEDDAADRRSRWQDLEAQGRPLVVLIGGATGVGKSTIASLLARELGITRVSSTDFIRQVLRSVVPAAIAPELSRSSFELDRHGLEDGAGTHAEFERQASEVLVGVRAEIERAAKEGTSMILEGIHLFPGLLDLGAIADSVAVHVVLVIEDPADHEHRFAIRASASRRPAERYDDGLDEIRALQDHLVFCASRAGVPVIVNREEDATVHEILELVLAAADAALRAP